MPTYCPDCRRETPIDHCALCRDDADRFHAIFTEGRGETVGESLAAGLIASGLALGLVALFLRLVDGGYLAQFIIR